MRDAFGGLLTRIEVSWEAKASSIPWTELSKQLGLVFGDSGDIGWSTSFVVFDEPLSVQSRYIVGGAHEGASKGTANWKLSWARVPDSEPPSEFLEGSRRMGGLRGFLGRLGELWPAKDSSANIQAIYLFERPQWRTVLPLPIDQTEVVVQGMTAAPRVGLTEWRLSPPSGFLSSVSQGYDQSQSESQSKSVIIIARGDLKCSPSSDIFETLDKDVRACLIPFLSRPPGQSSKNRVPRVIRRGVRRSRSKQA